MIDSNQTKLSSDCYICRPTICTNVYNEENLKQDIEKTSKQFETFLYSRQIDEEISILKKLASKYQRSRFYNHEIAVKVFYEHFITLKSKKFNPTQACAFNDFLFCPAIVEALLKSGADINELLKLTDEVGACQFPHYYRFAGNHYCYEYFSENSLNILLKYRTDFNCQLKGNGATPLWIQVSCCDKIGVRLLVKAKADINFETSSPFSTPLMKAADQLDIPMLSILLELGADLFLINSQSKTAADLAREEEVNKRDWFLIKNPKIQFEISDYLYKKMDEILVETKSLLDTKLPLALRKVVIQYISPQEYWHVFDSSYLKYQKSILDRNPEQNDEFLDWIDYLSFIYKKLFDS